MLQQYAAASTKTVAVAAARLDAMLNFFGVFPKYRIICTYMYVSYVPMYICTGGMLTGSSRETNTGRKNGVGIENENEHRNKYHM